MVEPKARYDEISIPLEAPVHGLEQVRGVLGIPEWWPTGMRVGVVIAHGSARDLDDPLVVGLQQRLTEKRYLTLRFNFPFAEAGKKRPDPMPVLVRCYRAAVEALGRDTTAAPAHLFIGGAGVGGEVATRCSTARLRADGVFCIGYTLHSRDDPKKNLRAEAFFRVVTPMLFIQGTRDRHCDLDTLRRTLARVGAPTLLHVVPEADQHFQVPKRSGRSFDHVLQEIFLTLDAWFQRVLGGE